MYASHGGPTKTYPGETKLAVHPFAPSVWQVSAYVLSWMVMLKQVVPLKVVFELTGTKPLPHWAMSVIIQASPTNQTPLAAILVSSLMDRNITYKLNKVDRITIKPLCQ